MENVAKAAGILQQAEADLRRLVSEAAASGDYASVVQIAAWARTVSDLVKVAPGQQLQVPAPSPQAKRKPGKVKATPRRTARPAEGAYPRFFRQADQLIRVAWSKKEKKEYQHKTPYVVLQSLARAMAEAGKAGRIFSTEQVLPITDSDGAEIPAYQAYVGIALLKHTALIDQHGRQGYSIPRLPEFKDSIETIWRKLPEQ